MLLAVRHKLIAHSDNDAATGAFTAVLRTISGGGVTITAPSELLVRAVGVAGPRDYDTAKRVRAHAVVVAEHFERAVRAEAAALAQGAAVDVEKFIEAFGGRDAFTKHPDTEVTLDASKNVAFPRVPVDPLNAPTAEVRPDLHLFRASVLQVRPKTIAPVPGRPGESFELNSHVPEAEVVRLERDLMSGQ